MSVLGCDRSGCTNIMCDRLSHIHGYICNECFDELVSTGPKTDVVFFMLTPKDSSTDSGEALARYTYIFKGRTT